MKKKEIIALNIDIPQPEQLPEETQKYLNICQEKLGLVPNVLKTYTHEMQQFNAFSQLYNAIMFADTGLTPLEREMIAVVVSSKNHCFYCLTAHGNAVREYSKDPILGELLVMNYKSADLSKRHRAMLDFASKLTTDPSDIDDTDRKILRDAEFTEKEIWDIASVASFYNMTNRMASAVDMQPNDEYHFMNREDKSK
tara:strand:- start:1017 stop:1607 length:591 start_codon:yes stop_codon:yes gene_type:complete